MAQPLTLELARVATGAIVLSKKTTGRSHRPARLVRVLSDKTVLIRPGGHGKDEVAAIDDYYLGGKQVGRIADVIAPYIELEKNKPKPAKQEPKFNGNTHRKEKPVIALTQEDIAEVEQAKQEQPPVSEALHVLAEPVAEKPVEPAPMNPREAHRQKQIQAAAERFILVDRRTRRFYTVNKKWVPELGLARKYERRGALTACGVLKGSRGHAKARDIEVMTTAQAAELVSHHTGVNLNPTPKATPEPPAAAVSAPPAPVATAPVVAASSDAVRAAFDAWSKSVRDEALAEQMRLECMVAVARTRTELEIELRKRELGL
jgi:hypothetical protein